MKSIKMFLSSILFGLILISFSSCKQTNTHDDMEKHHEAHETAYICPMHCDGSGSDQPGKCPVCDMDYVKNENYLNTEATETEINVTDTLTTK